MSKKFCYAIRNNDEESLTRLLLRYGTDKTITMYIRKGGPLFYAVLQKKPLMVDLILRSPGTNVDTKTSNGETSLYKARPPCIGIIISLLNRNGIANVNLANNKRKTPLMISSGFGNVVVMNLLIKAGANIDAVDNLKRTAVIYALMNNESDALKLLLCCNAKLSIPTCQDYDPLSFALNVDIELGVDHYVDILIPYCKRQKNFGGALVSAILTERLNVFQKLIMNGAKFRILQTSYWLKRVISDKRLANLFDLLWPNINHEDYLNPKTFAMLISNIFRQRDRVSFFKSSLKMIINTPVFHCILSGDCEHLVISTIFSLNYDPDYDWTLCKDILLDFCEYINKLGIKLKNYDLIIFVHYFQFNKCQFITELLAVFFKYDPDLVSMYDVINFSILNDLKLTSQLLYNCSDFNYIGSIYEFDNVKEFSEDVLKFFLQHFTPIKSDPKNIRSLKKFDNLNIESLNVPSLMEIARNAMKKAAKNSELKELIKNLNIYSDLEDILYFKTIMNRI